MYFTLSSCCEALLRRALRPPRPWKTWLWSDLPQSLLFSFWETRGGGESKQGNQLGTRKQLQPSRQERENRQGASTLPSHRDSWRSGGGGPGSLLFYSDGSRSHRPAPQSLGPQPRTSLQHLLLLLLRRHQIEGGILPLVDTHLAQMTEPDSLSNDRGH